MDKDKMYEIIRAIEAIQGDYYTDENRPKTLRSKDWRSENRMWDYIICRVCAGCGKPLGRYEYRNNLAFCYQCREILFPESVSPHETFRNRNTHFRPKGHSL